MTRSRKQTGMTAADFRRIALSLDGAEQGSHMGAVDFRVGGRIFATLAHAKLGYGNLMLTPEEQAPLVDELPDVFLPVAGGWGRMGATHIVLAKANEDLLRGALQTAWRLRVAASARSQKRPARADGRAQSGRGRTARSRR
jgi:hypothetical protein